VVLGFALICAAKLRLGAQVCFQIFYVFDLKIWTALALFSFPPGTEMFHFPGFAHRAPHGNSKFEYQNSKQYQNLNDQNSKLVLGI